jgi:hypothetical protein
MLTRTLTLFAILRLVPTLYRGLYWGTDMMDIALRFLIVWEVFRHAFPRGSVVRQIVSKGFAIVAFGLMIFAVGMFWSYESYTKSHSVYLALNRSFGFAQGAMVLGTLLAARYYGIQFGKNLWGMAVAFGAWVSVSTVNNAMVDLKHSFLPYWELLRPLSFVIMLLVWVQAIWAYQEATRTADLESIGQVPEIAQWEEGWDRAIANVRRVMHP